MKSTDQFKQIIASHLTERAATDSLFATKYQNPEKNIDNCITYILNTVQKSGCNGFADDEVFSMAVHYYDEESIEIGNPISAKVVVNHSSGMPTTQEPAQVTTQTTVAKKPMAKKPKIAELTPSLFD